MKTIVKWIGILIALLLLIVGGFAAFISIKGVPKYPVNMPNELVNLKVESSPEKIARGYKMASVLCNQCHTGKDEKLSGKFLPDIPAELGTVYSANITQDLEKGIGKWTDGQIIYFLRTGIRPDGQYVPPYMPKFPNMANSDIEAIVAYLRSNAKELQASQEKMPKNQPNLLVKMLTNVGVMNALPYPSKVISIPDTANKIAFGKYVANDMIVCYACHSADFKTNNELEPEKSAGFYAGGNPLLNEEGKVIKSANITLDVETGFGKFTELQFIEAVKYCKNPRGGNPLRYPMIPHTTLSDYELSSVYAYLQTIPKISNKVDK